MISERADVVDPQLRLHLGYSDNELGATGWFAGNHFTAADVQTSFPLEAATARGMAAQLPAIGGFFKRIHARPAYRRALERGGKCETLGGN